MYTIVLFIPPDLQTDENGNLIGFTLPPSASSRSPLSLLARGRAILKTEGFL